ncbi:MAG: hypothetical protein E7523_02685 [Ruminococcaceae bacterium]|nr:hypothetical protein [Oscillospiraceae bacterium]
MEHTAQLPKKLLSLLLSLLMIFSACYAGVNGVYTVYAAAGDSKYTHEEVIESINAALADGKSYSGSNNAFTVTGDNGKTLAAAEAIFDYAVKTYRGGRADTASNNSGDTLLAAFLSEFKNEFSNADRGTQLATAVLNPAGTTVKGYENRTWVENKKKTGQSSNPGVGADYTANATEWPSGVPASATKTVSIKVDVDAFLQSYDLIDDIPSSFLTEVSYTYAYAQGKYAETTKVDTVDGGCGDDTYDVTYKSTAWNYMSAKPVRTVTKNTTAKKYLKSILKFFNEEVLAYTQEDLLDMPLSTLEYLDKQAVDFQKMMNDNFNDATLAHFDVPKSDITAFINRLAFAHKVVAAKSAIDTMDALVGSEYNVESYSQMSSLYNKVNSAYNVANNMQSDVKTFILANYPEVAAKYNSINFTEAKAYIDTLHEIMTEQRLEEMVNSMMAKYDQYDALLIRENVNVPSDPEVSSLLSSKNSWNALLGTYTSKAYYRTYYTSEIEAKWLSFAAKIDAVAEVRGLKAEYQTYYNYFYPIIYTADINNHDNDFLMTLYDEMDTQLVNLIAKYNDIKANYNQTIADNIFTLNYEGQNVLLQNIVTNSSTAGKNEIKNVLVARTEQQIDNVQAYAGVTTVNFDNFAVIKSTISHFDYDLYDFVTGEGKAWLSSDYISKYAMVQTLLDRYHAFSKAGDGGKSFFDEDFTFEEDGYYAIRYAGDYTVSTGEVDENGDAIVEQLGYPNDLVRDGADDNYYVTEQTMVDTIAKLDGFITSRDFGALLDFYNEEEDAYVGLKEYLNMMLEEMLYNDKMINTLVGAIFPMICDMIANELVGAIGDLDGATVDANGVPWLDLGVVAADAVSGLSGSLGVYLDTNYVSSYRQKDFPTVFKELGLYIYPYTLAQSLAISNPSFYGTDSEIYQALTAAGRDWSNLVMEDDPDTLDVDETKVLEFAWGVYDQDSFLDTLACILDSILPLLQTLLSTKPFSEGVSNAAIAYSSKISLLVSANNVYIEGGLQLDIPALNVYGNYLVPLFEVLGVKDIPTLSADCSGDDVTQAIFGTLLKRVDEILNAPLSTILEILPNLVYYLSMDSVQELLDALSISLTLTIHEVEVLDTDSWLVGGLLDALDTQLAGVISFDVELVVADLINDQGGLYGLLGFELTNFNEVITGLIPMLGGLLGGEESAIDLSALTLPPIRQQDIIFCSDWVGGAGDQSPLVANKGDLLYWLLDYLVSALEDPAFMDMIMGLLGSSEEGGISGMITPLIQKITASFAGNPRGALAAIMEVLNPVSYDLKEMTWVESQWGYEGIDGLQPVDMIYLDYSNDWTEDKANYLVDNFDSLLTTILEMVEMDLGDAETLGAFLQSKINALFTNANITKLVEMLCGLGDSASAVIADVVTNQVGINIASWFKAFGYLFPAETWAEDAEIIKPTDKAYINNFGIEGVANEDGTISWFFNRMPLVDGDGYTFVNILSRLLGEAQILIEFLFAGEDISAFADVVKLIGYETFESTLGMLMEAIGVVGVPSQAQFNADPMGSFTNTLIAVLDWFYALTDAEDFASQLLELIPDLFYYIESNGLSVLLQNLLMPVLVLVDTIRPLFDINLNQLLSIILSEFVSYRSLNIDTILQYVLNGVYISPDDPEYVQINIDINNLRVSDILKIADALIGTNLYASNLVEYGITGLCSGVVDVTTDEGYAYKMTTVSAADAITILVTGLLEALNDPAQDATKTNGEVLFAFLGEMMNSATIAGLYPVLAGILEGIDVTYTEPNWGYMLSIDGDFNNVPSPRDTFSYLAYTTDWTPEAADALYNSLGDLISLIAADFDGNVAKLVNSMLEDNVYSDANLNMIVELIVNLFAGFNTSLFDLVDVLIDTDIAAWFAMCVEGTDAETGEPKLVCTKDWGVDEATDKRATFVAALKEVLTPANALLEWLFLGDDYAFFTGADKDADDNYIYNDVITLAGGAGYDRAIVPIFKALGIDLAPAASFATGVDAVEAILNSLFDLIDSLTTAESTIEGVVQLLPNLIYFLNADGVKSAVNNLLAPVNALLDMVGPLLGDGKEISITALLGDALPIDITDITTEAVLDLLTELKVGENEEPLNIQFVAYDEDGNVLYDLGEILSTLYVGELSAYTYAEKLTGYTLDITDREGDVLTLVISFALEMFLLNEELFTGLLGEEAAAIIESISGLLKGYAVTYTDPDWAYMYEGDDALAKLAADGFPTVEFTYLAYANDWDEDVAVAAYDALDEILVMIMDSVAEGSTIGQLLHDVITDKLYTDANLNSVVELIVNAIAGFDANLLDLIGAVLDADIATWFTFCEVNADGKYECTKDWGVDAASDAGAKKAAFVAGLKEVLAPANELLAWLFFGESYTFFNGSDGEAIITLKGGEGYKQGLVPIFEALGCTMKSADAYYDATTKTYNVGNAVADILDSALALVDEISANPIEEVFALIPNLLYFINADGLTASVENLLAPVNAVLAELSDVVGADNLQALLANLINFDLSNLGTDAVFALLATKAGFITNAEMVATVKNIYGLGEAASFTSVNGETAYRVDITGREYDVLTVILSFALDAFKLNGTIFSELLGAEQYQAVLNLLAGATEEFEYADINWAYMYDGDLAQLVDADGEFPVRTGSAYTIYTQYQNNWNEATADYLNDVLDTLVQEIIKIAKDENTSIGKMLDNAITRGLYTNSLLNSLIEAVVGALIDYEDIIVKAGVLLDAQGLATWFDDYCTVDAEGNVTCTKDWGIDSATTNEAKRDAFVEGFVEALQPAYRLLAWLLFEKDFEFLTDYAGADHITITGGAGYDEAFVPLLEALGATMKPASAYTDADGNIDMENVVRDVFTALTDILYAICGDLQNPGEKGAIGTILDLLPNVIYFINADGVKAVVNNLLAPVNFILKELNAFGVEVDFATLIEGIDITNLDWYAVFDIVEDLVPLYFPDFTQEFLATLYMGKAESYTSANGETAYRMVYTEEESRRDMITVVISFVGDAFIDARNKDQLVDWMGEDIYKVLLTYLSGNAVSVEVQEFDWLFTEYAGTGTVLSPMLVGSLNGLVYGKYFTPEMGRYMEENLPGFVDTVIELLGIEAEDGETTYADLEDVLDTLIGDTIYTKANLDAIVTALPELIASLKESLGEELFTMIAEVLNRALGIDLTYWNDYRVADIEDGNREQFVNELIRVFKPTYPILAWLLTGDDLIALFHSADGTGRDMIVVEGAEGYAYGIIPLMEALACENIRTLDEFKIAADSQPENMLRLIIDPILDKVDLILADPVNEIFEVLPAVIYFLNSNGLDTVIKNTANAIFAVLENLEPAIGELDVYKLIGFDPTELNINTLIEQLLTDLEESTGLTFKDMAMDAIVELTVGEVVEFTSKNGETAYTMKYVSAEDRADMTSVILRFVMSFVAVEENARALKIMLKDELSEDGFKFVCALFDNFVDMAKTTDGMDKILYTIYYIFIGAEGVVEGVDGSLDEANDNYKFMQDLFAKSDVEFLNNIAGTLGDFLDSNFKDIVDSAGIIPNGFIKFFQKLIELFEKIINWFKGFLN